MFVPWLLLAAPVIAALLSWGTWFWAGVSVVIAIVQYLAYRRTGRFSDRLWRTVGHGRRSRAARAADSVYLLAVVAGIAVLVLALFVRLR